MDLSQLIVGLISAAADKGSSPEKLKCWIENISRDGFVAAHRWAHIRRGGQMFES
jgi:hypothetical protein